MTAAGSAARNGVDRIRSSSARQTRLFALGVVIATQFAFAWRFAHLSAGGALLYVAGLWGAVILADQALRSRRRHQGCGDLAPGELASAPASLRCGELHRLRPDINPGPGENTLFGTLSVRAGGVTWVPLVNGTPELDWPWSEIQRVDSARYTWVPTRYALGVVLASGADVVFLLDDARPLQRVVRQFVTA